MVQSDNIRGGEVELSCPDLQDALRVFGTLGFAVEMIMPADDPQVAVISGHGLRLRLERGTRKPPGAIRLVCRDPRAIADGHLIAGGIRIDLVAERTTPVVPPNVPKFTVVRDEPDAWRAGRADMQYRDLIPDRHGGRYIASHICVPYGGPVPDYVHFHSIRFQLIYCYKGWVKLVYEDQGAPFVMQAGDCIVQPPRIRHRVLESSDGLEVVEITCPAMHETYADPETVLPTPTPSPHDFDGQSFKWHRTIGTQFDAQSLGIATASSGLAGARVLTRAATPPCTHDAELLFGFVLRGELTVTCNGVGGKLIATDAFAIPPHTPFQLTDGSSDLAWLEVSLPARVEYTRVR
ncbi:MAG: cupin [Deltaproteobacteria bacterium]|nr:cupin [Deltaproteobacteria bacterium]